MSVQKRIARGLCWVAPTLLIAVTVIGCAPVDVSGGAMNSIGAESDSKAAPDFRLEDVEGGKFSLADTAGSVRLIDFWATWCAPCREEIPMLNRLHETYGEQGLEIVAISEEKAEHIRNFVDENAVDYRNLVGDGDVFEAYGVPAMPTAFLVDQEGVIVAEWYGPKPEDELEDRIRGLLGL